jgi:adenine-specific DNA-methyltransferase
MDKVFSEENHIGTAVWKRTVSSPLSGGKILAAHDFILSYQRTSSFKVKRLKVNDEDQYKNPDNDPRGPYKLQKFERTMSGARPTMTYEIETPTGPIKRTWSGPRQTFEKLFTDNRIVFSKSGLPQYKQFLKEVDGRLPSTWWEIPGAYNQNAIRELTDLFGDANFDTTKPTGLIEHILQISPDNIVMDFFAGSGTTAHAVINLNREDGGRRKYILVEMGEHFNTVILPRVKKVVFSDKWKDGKAVPPANASQKGGERGKGISHFAKYYQLEQYEDTLRRARYEDGPLLAGVDAYNSYVFLRDLKLLEAVTLDKAQNQVKVNLAALYPGIDLAETLSCVTGKGIKRLTGETVEFQDGTRASLAEPDWTLVKPLIWW